MSETRKLAVQMLQDILEKKVFFSEVKAFHAAENHEDSAFINMLVLTALRNLIFLKRTLKQFVKKKLPDNMAFGQYALLLATAEILFLDTPDYAVINSYVDITKKQTDKYVAGFVNAVLRNICRQKEELKKQDNGEFFPPEFLGILHQSYGKKIIQKIQAAAAIEPPLDLTVKTDAAGWAQKLNATLLPNGTLRLKNAGKITALPGYGEGAWWVQDVAASLAVKALGNIKGQHVLDLCAAPGGKTAQLINAGAQTTALDISEPRLKILQENLERLQLPAQKIICADALDYLTNFNEELYDIILLDAPCSATGTIRRHPELVHIKKAQDVQKLAKLQKDFLEVTGKALRPGGILLYCTCSITKDEGEKQIQDFLNSHPDFHNLPIEPQTLGNQELQELITEEGFIRTLPYHFENLGGCDAFFIARLQKAA